MYIIGDAPYGWVPYTGGNSNIIYVFTEHHPPLPIPEAASILPNLSPLTSYVTSNLNIIFSNAGALNIYDITKFALPYTTDKRSLGVVGRGSIDKLSSDARDTTQNALRALAPFSIDLLNRNSSYSSNTGIESFETNGSNISYSVTIDNRQSVFIK